MHDTSTIGLLRQLAPEPAGIHEQRFVRIADLDGDVDTAVVADLHVDTGDALCGGALLRARSTRRDRDKKQGTQSPIAAHGLPEPEL